MWSAGRSPPCRSPPPCRRSRSPRSPRTRPGPATLPPTRTSPSASPSPVKIQVLVTLPQGTTGGLGHLRLHDLPPRRDHVTLDSSRVEFAGPSLGLLWEPRDFPDPARVWANSLPETIDPGAASTSSHLLSPPFTAWLAASARRCAGRTRLAQATLTLRRSPAQAPLAPWDAMQRPPTVGHERAVFFTVPKDRTHRSNCAMDPGHLVVGVPPDTQPSKKKNHPVFSDPQPRRGPKDPAG
jgi:hypothetical protein